VKEQPVPQDVAIIAVEVHRLLARDGGCWCTWPALRNWLRDQGHHERTRGADCTSRWCDAGLIDLPDHVAARRTETHPRPKG
jgi:hypothetical protein